MRLFKKPVIPSNAEIPEKTSVDFLDDCGSHLRYAHTMSRAFKTAY
jgi:hypothetical protein